MHKGYDHTCIGQDIHPCLEISWFQCLIGPRLSRILWHCKAHYHVHKGLSQDFDLSQLNPADTLTHYFVVYFNIILHSTPGSTSGPFPACFPNKAWKNFSFLFVSKIVSELIFAVYASSQLTESASTCTCRSSPESIQFLDFLRCMIQNVLWKITLCKNLGWRAAPFQLSELYVFTSASHS
jgi:hypothetical protein